MSRDSAPRINKITEAGDGLDRRRVSYRRFVWGKEKKNRRDLQGIGRGKYTRRRGRQHVDAANKDVSKFLTCHGVSCLRSDGWWNFLSPGNPPYIFMTDFTGSSYPIVAFLSMFAWNSSVSLGISRGEKFPVFAWRNIDPACDLSRFDVSTRQINNKRIVAYINRTKVKNSIKIKSSCPIFLITTN